LWRSLSLTTTWNVSMKHNTHENSKNPESWTEKWKNRGNTRNSNKSIGRIISVEYIIMVIANGFDFLPDPFFTRSASLKNQFCNASLLNRETYNEKKISSRKFKLAMIAANIVHVIHGRSYKKIHTQVSFTWEHKPSSLYLWQDFNLNHIFSTKF
jgi:hypothetical protein